MNRQAYIDEQALCRNYSVGDIVLFPIYTRGNNYAPNKGRVTAVLDKIGFLDVETVFGNIRISPSDVVKAEFQSSDLPNTSEATYDRMKSLQRTASTVAKQYLQKLSDASDSISSAQEGFDSMELREARLGFIKEALYWKSKGRKFCPTQEEIDSGCFHCPKCKAALSKAIYQKRNKLYVCLECLWMITVDDLLDPTDEPKDLGKKQDVTQEFFSAHDPLLKHLREE